MISYYSLQISLCFYVLHDHYFFLSLPNTRAVLFLFFVLWLVVSARSPVFFFIRLPRSSLNPFSSSLSLSIAKAAPLPLPSAASPLLNESLESDKEKKSTVAKKKQASLPPPQKGKKKSKAPSARPVAAAEEEVYDSDAEEDDGGGLSASLGYGGSL